MSEREPDSLDKEMIEAIHALALATIATGDRIETKDANKAKGDRYRRIGQMLEGMALGVRDPLLVAFWERTSADRSKAQFSNELVRRGTAVAAVYLRWHEGGEKPSRACKVVSKDTGESFETLRNRFKGMTLEKFRNSTAGTETFHIIEMALSCFASKPDWQTLYQMLVDGARQLSKDIETDRKRVRQFWLNSLE
jgi:hypothetical protein